MTRIWLSPRMSGLAQGFVQEPCASNWIAPLGPQVDAFEADPSTRPSTNSGHCSGHGLPRPPAHRMRWHSVLARPRCTWPSFIRASARATRCWSPPSPSRPAPTPSSTRAPNRPSLTASEPPGTWTPHGRKIMGIREICVPTSGAVAGHVGLGRHLLLQRQQDHHPLRRRHVGRGRGGAD